MATAPASSPGLLSHAHLVELGDFAAGRARELVQTFGDHPVDAELIRAWDSVRVAMGRITRVVVDDAQLDPEVIQASLMELGLPEEVRVAIHDKTLGALRGTLDARRYHENRLALAKSNLHFKGRGVKFLEALFVQSSALAFDVDHAELVRLSREVADTLRGSGGVDTSKDVYRYSVDLIYVLNGGDIRSTAHLVRGMLNNFADGHLPSTEPDEGSADNNEFDVLLRFLSVYADVSESVVAAADDEEGQSALLFQRARFALQAILKDPRLQISTADPHLKVSFFDLLQLCARGELTQEGGSVIDPPWFVGNLDNTPYEARRVAGLVHRDISRHSLVLILDELNRFSEGHGVGDKEFPKNPVVQALLVFLLDLQAIATRQIPSVPAAESAIEPLRQTRRPKRRRSEVDSSSEMESIRLQDEEQRRSERLAVQRAEAQARGIRELFFRLLKSLMVANAFCRDEDLPQGVDQPRDLLALSLKAMLHRTDEAAYAMDLPIVVPRKFKSLFPIGHCSIRSLLSAVARLHFSDDELTSILATPRGDRIAVPAHVAVGHVFDSAKQGMRDVHLARAGEMMDQLWRGELEYERLVAYFAEAAAYLFEGAHSPRKATFRYYPYAGATAAWSSFFSAVFTSRIQGNPNFNIVASNQEYVSIAYPRGFDPRNVRIFPLSRMNEENERVKKTKEEIFESICALVDDNTGVILMSTVTRFGDSICEDPKDLAWVIAQIKERFPDVCVALDGSQSLGRGPLDRLDSLSPDVYFTSGGKALGTPGGLLAVARKFEPSKRFSFNASLQLEQTAAFALALDALARPDDDYRVQGNLGSDKGIPFHAKLHARLNELTRRALERANRYEDDLLSLCSARPGFHIPPMEFPSDGEGFFSCEVLYPCPSPVVGGHGIVTVAFPSANANRLVNGCPEWDFVAGLRSRGFVCDVQPPDKRILRISFNPCQTVSDVDALFDALLSVHSELLKAQYDRDGRYRYKPPSSWGVPPL